MRPPSDAPGRRPARLDRPDAPGTRATGYPARFRPRVLAVAEGNQTRSLMVGPVRGPEHLELIRRLHYYHVPVSAIAASRIGVSFIALYQPSARFGLSAGLVQEYAAVQRVSRVRRSQLPGLAWPGRRGQQARYYRFDLGPLFRLPRPITNPDRLRVVFRFPDAARFCGAKTVRQLVGPGRPRRRPSD